MHACNLDSIIKNFYFQVVFRWILLIVNNCKLYSKFNIFRSFIKQHKENFYMKINNQIAFTAKMDLSQVQNNKERWQNIAKIFEEETKEYPNDTFYISDSSKRTINIDAETSVSESNYEEHSSDILMTDFKNLLNESDETIANKFVKLFKLFRQYDDGKKCASKLFDILTKDQSEDVKEEYAMDFWDKAFDILDSAFTNNKDKDPSLEHFNVDY